MKQAVLRHRRLWILLGAVALLVAFFVWQNNHIGVSRHEIAVQGLPAELDGYTIAHISDLHNKDFGTQLTDRVGEEAPDIIVITGDLIDRRRCDVPTAVRQVEALIKLAPVCYVCGNHEMGSEHNSKLLVELEALGVFLMDDQFVQLAPGLCLVGMSDPTKQTQGLPPYNERMTAMLNTDDFTLLLSHRPERFSDYVDAGAGLVFAGHAHGGQVRLPFVGALYAPNQGLLPGYTSGLYESQNTRMLVSRGLGNSRFPLRVFNRPELIIARLGAA